MERARVEQQVDALAGEQLAPVVLALPGPVGAGSERLFLALGQVGEPVAHRVVDHAATVPGGSFRAPKSSARPASFGASHDEKPHDRRPGRSSALLAARRLRGLRRRRLHRRRRRHHHHVPGRPGRRRPDRADGVGAGARRPGQRRPRCRSTPPRPRTSRPPRSTTPTRTARPLVFLVEEDRGEWLKVLLPDPPQRLDRVRPGGRRRPCPRTPTASTSSWPSTA